MKDTTRQLIIAQRNQLTLQQVKQLSHDICQRISQHQAFKDSSVVAMYYPFKNEVSLKSLYNTKKNVVLPVVLTHHRMQFRHHNPESETLINNKFGIAEPINGTFIEPNDIDLCLLPLTGFDRTGQRLGMGGGYYDRYFELNKFNKKPTILAGVAYHFQESDTIVSEPWDVPLDIIFTNHETIEL